MVLSRHICVNFCAFPLICLVSHRVLLPDSSGVMWARFYDVDTNEPFFSGRDSQRHKTIAEVENERRIGYAWYGTWPTKLLATEYPEWKKKWSIK